MLAFWRCKHGYRRSRQFCSDRCRVAANRAKRRHPEVTDKVTESGTPQ